MGYRPKCKNTIKLFKENRKSSWTCIKKQLLNTTAKPQYKIRNKLINYSSSKFLNGLTSEDTTEKRKLCV